MEMEFILKIFFMYYFKDFYFNAPIFLDRWKENPVIITAA